MIELTVVWIFVLLTDSFHSSLILILMTWKVIEIKKFEEKKEVSLSGKDIYEKFELSLPFARSAAFDTFTAIRNAHVKLGKENFVTIESL